MWVEIKAVILGRAIGLHRITGTTGKEIEISFKKAVTEEFKIDENQENLANSQCNTPNIPNIKRTNSNTFTNEPTSKKAKKLNDVQAALVTSPSVESAHGDTPSKISVAISQKPIKITDSDLKPCHGITCGNEKVFWCQECNFEQNKIKKNAKQCQRCGRFMTAMKKTRDISLSIMENTKFNTCEKIVLFCKQHPNNLQHQYISFMNLLDSHLGIKVHPNEAKSKSKNNKKTPERFKLICKILHRCILHFAKKYDSDTNIIQSTSKLISTTILQTNQKHISCKDATKIRTFTNSIFGEKSYITQNAKTTKTKLTTIHAISANSPNIYLAGAAISQAVEVIRARLTWNLFVAHADAYLNINSWSSNQPWSNFARIFTSQRVIDQKPNGTYIIPFFSGREASGHWHLIVIEKRRHFCEGWHVDSLGKTLDNTDLQSKLRQAFLPGRGRFVWNFPSSVVQTECECGPRTILAMHLIDKHVANGFSTGEAVTEATLSTLAADSYDSAEIRLEAALLLDSYTGRSSTRLRRPSAGSISQSKRRRIQSGEDINSNAEVDIIDLA